MNLISRCQITIPWSACELLQCTASAADFNLLIDFQCHTLHLVFRVKFSLLVA
jgi:hypothetical protein